MATTTSTQKELQVLFQHGALGPGSNLWIIPDLSISHWSKTLDWYVNFQISRAKNHRQREADPELLQTLEQNDLDYETVRNNSKVLMIASEGRLPNKQLVELAKHDNIASWIKSAYEVWHQLKQPTLRLFLPENIDSNEFLKVWPDKEHTSNITIVPSQST